MAELDVSTTLLLLATYALDDEDGVGVGVGVAVAMAAG
jgi:hypothetical protein